VLSEIGAVARAEIDPAFEQAGADTFDVREIATGELALSPLWQRLASSAD
jgi:hypothetical protein